MITSTLFLTFAVHLLLCEMLVTASNEYLNEWKFYYAPATGV